MMEKSMASGQSSLKSSPGGGEGVAGGAAAGGGGAYSNFSSVNEMLKGFMELQKEQLKVEKAKAEANKAKVDLAMDYEEEEKDDDYIAPSRYLFPMPVSSPL